MNESGPSPLDSRAVTAFQVQLAKLISLRDSNTQDPNFVRWRSTTVEVFKRYLPDADSFSTFNSIQFEGGYFELPTLPGDPNSPFNRACNYAKGCLEAAIEHIQMFGLDRPEAQAKAKVAAPEQEVWLLISHSAKDVKLAESLINLLRAGLGLLASQIRCTSVDGYRLPAGVDTHEQLRKEISTAKLLVGLLTPNSLASTYVLFELGARWGAGLPMIPLLAGVSAEAMRGPHSVLNAVSCETNAQLIQLVEDIGLKLRIKHESASSYQSQLHEVRELAAAIVPATEQDKQPGNQTGNSGSAKLKDEVQHSATKMSELSRKPYEEHLGKKGELLLSRLSTQGKRLMRHLVENEPLEVGRNFFTDIPNDVQFQQLTIAMEMRIIRHREVRVGSGMLLRTDYEINPQFVPVLRDLLYGAE